MVVGKEDAMIGLSIIIVNYKNYELTCRCIQFIIKSISSLPYEIIIIDNNSPNESFEILIKEFEKYTFINVLKNNKNRGFGWANNWGAEIAKYDTLLFLNPDIIVLDNAIEKMFCRLKENINIGLVACQLLNEDLTIQYSARRFLRLFEFGFSRTPLSIFAGKRLKNHLEAKYLMLDFDHQHEKYVDWVMGSSMMINKSFFQNINGFSKEYFMYFEDVDLCYKVNFVGKKVLYYPNAQMIHVHMQESKKSINKLTLVHLESMIKFYCKSTFSCGFKGLSKYSMHSKRGDYNV